MKTKLSQRQRQVVSLIAGGMTAKEVAAALGLSPRTVEHYAEAARRKYRAVSTVQLVYFMRRVL